MHRLGPSLASLTRPCLWVVWYADTWYMWHKLGWAGPVACYAFFVVGVACNALCARHLVGLVYRQASTRLPSSTIAT